MNKILFSAEEVPLPPWTDAAESYIQGILKILGHDNWEVSVLFCGNKYIKTLNARYRGKDEPTDILSFPPGENFPPAAGPYVAGDLVISLDALEENACFFKVSEDEELRRLLVHGILHLSGADHATNDSEEPMLRTQEEIVARLKEAVIMGRYPAAAERVQ